MQTSYPLFSSILPISYSHTIFVHHVLFSQFESYLSFERSIGSIHIQLHHFYNDYLSIKQDQADYSLSNSPCNAHVEIILLSNSKQCRNLDLNTTLVNMSVGFVYGSTFTREMTLSLITSHTN